MLASNGATAFGMIGEVVVELSMADTLEQTVVATINVAQTWGLSGEEYADGQSHDVLFVVTEEMRHPDLTSRQVEEEHRQRLQSETELPPRPLFIQLGEVKTSGLQHVSQLMSERKVDAKVTATCTFTAPLDGLMVFWTWVVPELECILLLARPGRGLQTCRGRGLKGTRSSDDSDAGVMHEVGRRVTPRDLGPLEHRRDATKREIINLLLRALHRDKWDLVRVVTVSRVVFSESQPESEQW